MAEEWAQPWVRCAVANCMQRLLGAFPSISGKASRIQADRFNRTKRRRAEGVVRTSFSSYLTMTSVDSVAATSSAKGPESTQPPTPVRTTAS